IYKSYKLCYQARQVAQKSLKKHYNSSHNEVIEEITSQLVVMNQEQLVTICYMLTEFSNNKSVTDEESEKLKEQKLSNNTITKEEYWRNHLIALI
ncbi:9387_t:CDS:1, partial [Dentiscutata heterogama]